MRTDEQKQQDVLDAHEVACEFSDTFRDQIDEAITVLFNPDEGDSHYLAQMMKVRMNLLMDTLIEITKKVEEHE